MTKSLNLAYSHTATHLLNHCVKLAWLLDWLFGKVTAVHKPLDSEVGRRLSTSFEAYGGIYLLPCHIEHTLFLHWHWRKMSNMNVILRDSGLLSCPLHCGVTKELMVSRF